jgi:hypothetical protein
MTAFVAWFAFGYCVTDFVSNYLSDRRVNKLVKEMDDLYKSRQNG